MPSTKEKESTKGRTKAKERKATKEGRVTKDIKEKATGNKEQEKDTSAKRTRRTATKDTAHEKER